MVSYAVGRAVGTCAVRLAPRATAAHLAVDPPWSSRSKTMGVTPDGVHRAVGAVGATLLFGWVVLSAYSGEGVKVPLDQVSTTSVFGILIHLKVDLNRQLWDRSPGRVTRAEILSANERLAALPDRVFNSVMRELAYDSNPGSRATDHLGNYIEALAAKEPSKLTELVERIATTVDPSDTGPALVAQIRDAAWGHLTATLERLPLRSVDGPTRMDAIEAFGGGDVIGRKLVYDYALALLDRDTGDALLIVGSADRMERMAPGTMPPFVARIAAHDRAEVRRLERLVSDIEDPRRRVRGPPTSVRDFVGFAVSELGLTPDEATSMGYGLMVTLR